MAQVTLSEAALAKIETDWLLLQPVRFPEGGHGAIARLLRHHRSFSTDPSDNVTELGPGISLGFWYLKDIDGQRLLELDFSGPVRVFVGPPETFAVGSHRIDYCDGRFALTSLK